MLTRSVSELQIVRVADNQTGRCWADGQKVVVLSPAEHERLLAEAKEQGAREALAEFGRRLALSPSDGPQVAAQRGLRVLGDRPGRRHL